MAGASLIARPSGVVLAEQRKHRALCALLAYVRRVQRYGPSHPGARRVEQLVLDGVV